MLLYIQAVSSPDSFSIFSVSLSGLGITCRDITPVSSLAAVSTASTAEESVDDQVMEDQAIEGQSTSTPAASKKNGAGQKRKKSIQKTNNVLIVEQGAIGTSYGGWLADEIQRRFFDYLDQPVERVRGSETSPRISKVLERAAIARTEEVVEGMQRVMRNKGAL